MRYMLYLDTRELTPERDEELLAGIKSGHKIVLATPTPNIFRWHQIDHIINTPVGKYDIAETQILDYIKKHSLDIAGVVYWKDREIELAHRLTNKLGLVGNSLDSVLCVRNKVQTRKMIDEVGDFNPKYAVIEKENDIINASKTIKTPCLLKPAGNSGSRGIVKVTNQAELDTAYRLYTERNDPAAGEMYGYYREQFLMEEELQGTEHSIAGLVANGKVYITAITDKKFDRKLLMQYMGIVPSLLPHETQQKLAEMANQVITATKMLWGGFHLDVMLTTEGAKIMEVGGRLGGELINSYLIPLAYSGFSPYDAFINISQGKIPSIEPMGYVQRPSMQAAALIIIPPSTGLINKVNGLYAVSKHPAVRLVHQRLGPGCRTYLPQERFKQFEIAYLVFQCPLEEDISALSSEITELIDVEMKD